MRQLIETLKVKTRGPGLHDFTSAARRFVARAKMREGLLTCFIGHTSASLVIQENADPDVLADLEDFMKRLVSRDQGLYRHKTEGPDDMPAHIRSALTQTSLSIPIESGDMVLGTWQALYVFEHRDAGSERTITLHAIGE
jgi:secondary thiamine-phosphate synthase enzyme